MKVIVAAEEKDVKAMQQQTQTIADAAQAELAEAMPALQAAIDSLKALNKNDIVEIKSFPKPPPLVQMTMEAVCILKQEKPDWDTVGGVAVDDLTSHGGPPACRNFTTAGAGMPSYQARLAAAAALLSCCTSVAPAAATELLNHTQGGASLMFHVIRVMPPS